MPRLKAWPGPYSKRYDCQVVAKNLSERNIRKRTGRCPVTCRLSRLAVLLVLAVVPGCSIMPGTTGTGTVLHVVIYDHVSPDMLIAHRGDEIRWQNASEKTIRIGLLGNRAYDHVSCQHGFSWFGHLRDFATIEPGDYVSLCFSHTGVVRYNVWLDADDLRGSMTPTAAIKVERSS
jgi:hypothetical protein